MTYRMRRGWLLGLTLAITLVAAACGGTDANSGGGTGGGTSLSGNIAVDGSSTVAPISEAIAEEFNKEQSGVKVTVGTSGTGGGFTKFCAGETDVQDASRAITDQEKQACEAKGIKYQEFRIGLDGLAVVTSSQNQFVTQLNFDQLAEIWKQGGAKTWNRVDSKFRTSSSPSSPPTPSPAPTTSSPRRSWVTPTRARPSRAATTPPPPTTTPWCRASRARPTPGATSGSPTTRTTRKA